MTQQELVQAAQQGDRDAFSQLVQANQSLVYRLAYRMTGSPEDAADLTQEVFLSAWQALPRFQGHSAFSTWLYRLTTNACIDFLRRENRRRELSMTRQGEDEEIQLQAPDPRPSPEQALERRELWSEVERGLAALSPEHRQILLLREMEGLSYQEIAQCLELEEGTVKSRIARARLALRDFLKKSGNFFDAASSKE